MKAIFWILLLGLTYSYFIYPLILWLWPKPKAALQPSAVADNYPRLSLIITAYNEQARIREKLENSLQINYPADKHEIIVASDCSQDDTDAIVKEYADRGVRLVRADAHHGKEYAQSLAVQAANGEILVFSDAATRIPADAFMRLAEVFSNPEIGAVSSEDRFISENGEVAGEGLYVRYEMWLRQLESRLAGLVGLSGSFFAAHRKVCNAWDITVPSDFNTALNCRMLGFKAVADEQLVGIYKDIKNPVKEYQRKVRTVIRGMQALARKTGVLNMRRFGLFALQVWSHKVMRWAVPWLMLLFLPVSTYLLHAGGIYALLWCGQLIFYMVALVGWMRPAAREYGIVRIVFYFVQANIAVAHAATAFAAGKRITKWQPSER